MQQHVAASFVEQRPLTQISVRHQAHILSGEKGSYSVSTNGLCG